MRIFVSLVQLEINNLERQTSTPTKILLLTTSMLVDRVFKHTSLLDTLNRQANVSIWTTSYGNFDGESNWGGIDARVRPFPQIRPFREFPYNILRRLNEYVWDYRYLPPSRISIMEHVRSKHLPLALRSLHPPARLMAKFRSEQILENSIERLLLNYPRSREAELRLREDRPDVIVSTGPFQYEQPAIVSTSKNLKIPTLAYIPSWDNVSTKNRMVFKYDGFVVWNEQTKRELNDFYPYTKDRPVYVIGAPQFDVFHQTRYRTSREDFCAQHKLDPNLPVIVYAIGSPNFLNERHGAEYLAKRVVEGHLGDVQLLVRPHPIHDNAEMRALFDRYSPRVCLQQSPNAGKQLSLRTQDEDQIIEWVNTFRHADVVVNLSSTVTIDAAIFDKPVVNLDFDPQPGQADQELIKDINHKWSHFQPIAESGGVWLVNDFDEMEYAISSYLKSPDLHKNERKWIVETVCGYKDGNCGKRMADAILDFVNHSREVAGHRT